MFYANMLKKIGLRVLIQYRWSVFEYFSACHGRDALTIQHVELVILPLGILVICAKSIKVKLDIANVYLKSLKDK